jgi:hypothetical protein
MTPCGFFWIVVTSTPDNGLLYERLDQALDWADAHDRQGTELFVGVNARSMEGKTESWLLAKLQIKRLDDLLYGRAELVIRRLGEMARERANA